MSNARRIELSRGDSRDVVVHCYHVRGRIRTGPSERVPARDADGTLARRRNADSDAADARGASADEVAPAPSSKRAVSTLRKLKNAAAIQACAAQLGTPRPAASNDSIDSRASFLYQVILVSFPQSPIWSRSIVL